MSLRTMGIADNLNSPSVDQPFPAYGGLFRDQAIMLLRRFYVQENGKGMTLILATYRIGLLTSQFSSRTEAKERSTTQHGDSAAFSGASIGI